MSAAPPPEPSSRPRGSRRRFLIILCLVTLGGLLFYDAPLEPYDDLFPAAAEDAPDPEQNGYLYLQREWANLPKTDWNDRRIEKIRVAKLTSRALPWDDALAAKVRKGREKVVASLRHAAGLPRWVPSLIEQTDHGKYAFSLHSWRVGQSALIALEACAAARAGNAEDAFEIWRAQHIAGVRQIEGSRDLLTLFVGLGLQSESAALACDLLEWLPEDTTLLSRLEEHWRVDPFTDAVAENAVRGDYRWLWAELDRWGPLQEDGYTQWPFAARLLLKKNITMNRCTELVREFGGKLLTPAPTREASVTLAIEHAGRTTNPVSLKYFGNRKAAAWARGMGAMFRAGVPTRRFIPRAMRVRLALQRWRLARGETPPAVLEELVPEFLSEVPADPWNGQPLGWDPATWTVSAIGSKWGPTAFPKKFDSSSDWRAWISSFRGGPALRAKLPPGAGAGSP